jgi:hypothetical protein
MDRIEETRQLREEYEAALDEAETRRAEYHRAVLKLHRSGMPLRQIAEALGISHQRVHQIVTGEAAPKPKRRGRAGVVAVSLILLLGLFAGYIRLAHLPPFQLAKATVAKVPEVSGLSISDAKRVLSAFGFEQVRSRRKPSAAEPPGFVLSQRPSGDMRVPVTTPVSLTYSSGPGPRSSLSEVRLAHGVLIPITHNGSYSWLSRVVPDTPPFKAGGGAIRFIGNVVARHTTRLVEAPGGVRWSFTLTVQRFSGPAWLEVIDVTFRR